MTEADDAIERAYREEWTRLLATLAGQLGGDVGLAEEAVADAFTAAMRDWGAHVTVLTAEDHDRAASWLQAAAHAALLAWGLVRPAQARRSAARC